MPPSSHSKNNGTKRVVAAILVVANLSGCTIALGRAYQARPDQTQDRLDLANLSCTHDAEIGWQSFGHQTAQFFLWPFSIPWERHYKRATWQKCMVDKGYRVETPDGKAVNQPAPAIASTPVLDVPAPRSDEPPTSPRDAAWLACYHSTAHLAAVDFRPALDRCMKAKGFDAPAAALDDADVTTLPATDGDRCANLRCPDGKPGLWLGYAKSLGLSVGIRAYMCGTTPSRVEGQWNCSAIESGVGCVTDGGLLTGKIHGSRIVIQSDHLPGGRVASCRFDGGRTAPLVMAGDYVCSGAIGEVKGTFELRRCP